MFCPERAGLHAREGTMSSEDADVFVEIIADWSFGNVGGVWSPRMGEKEAG